MMTFNKGDKLEVFINCSWNLAEFMYSSGSMCMVLYEGRTTENTGWASMGAVRPRPPSVPPASSFSLGDLVDVILENSWKIGLVEGIIQDEGGNNDHNRDGSLGPLYVVYLLGFSSVTVDLSKMRKPPIWHHGDWAVSTYNLDIPCLELFKSIRAKLGLVHIKNDVTFSTGSGSRSDGNQGMIRPCGNLMTAKNTSADAVPNEEKISLPPSESLGLSQHYLELGAYRSTLMALHASGPLQRDQEVMLSDLRRMLHISDEEHSNNLKLLFSFKNFTPSQ